VFRVIILICAQLGMLSILTEMISDFNSVKNHVCGSGADNYDNDCNCGDNNNGT
jgi:hypothetical protein